MDGLVVDRGWFSGRMGPVVATYMTEDTTDESFGRYLKWLCGEIDRRTPGERRGALYHVPSPSAFSATRRTQLGEILEARREKLAATTAAYAMATSSAFVRGVMTAVFWLAPPPYPNKIVATPHDGLRFIARHLPGVDAKAMDEDLFATERRLSPQLLSA